MIYGDVGFPDAISVTELNTFIKTIFDNEPLLNDVFVRGEISNFKAHSSGHFYFSLKDEGGVLKSVMFRGSAVRLPFMPENGMKVIAHGRISAFVRDGQYQLYVDAMQPDGTGSLYVALEQLKAKLSAEGLFAEDRKKPLPKIPKTIGIVTSPTGAAIQDMINVMGRRFPYSEIILYPALVQGPDAPASISRGIDYFNKNNLCDVLIVGRGGGSIEDLWAFNTEIVARAIAGSNIPVISAVGHETDFTIADFVSDMRAPTPSAAAELAVPDSTELKRKINNIITREKAVLGKIFEAKRAILKRCSSSRALISPSNMIDEKRMTLLSFSRRADLSQKATLDKSRAVFAGLTGKLYALNPMAVISRGYSAVFDKQGKVIKSVEDISLGNEINLRMSDGTAVASIISKEKYNEE